MMRATPRERATKAEKLLAVESYAIGANRRRAPIGLEIIFVATLNVSTTPSLPTRPLARTTVLQKTLRALAEKTLYKSWLWMHPS
jgi:hypothetical protein